MLKSTQITHIIISWAGTEKVLKLPVAEIDKIPKAAKPANKFHSKLMTVLKSFELVSLWHQIIKFLYFSNFI